MSSKLDLRCFLDIGRDSHFRFMTLDMGSGWTRNNFVLVDGQFANSQPKNDFNSIPSINFQWLTNINTTIKTPQTKTSSGIFIFYSSMSLYVDLVDRISNTSFIGLLA